MKDIPVEIIPFVLLLSICLTLSVNIVLPIYKESLELKYEVEDNKSVKVISGNTYNAVDTDNIGLTGSEVILMVCQQSYFMPKPRVMEIGGSKLEIQPDAMSSAESAAREGGESGGTSFDSDTSNMFIPMTAEALHEAQTLLSTWTNEFISSYSSSYGVSKSNIRFDFRFSTYEAEGEDDDCYSLHLIGKDKNEAFKAFRCLEGGKLENYDTAFDLNSSNW